MGDFKGTKGKWEVVEHNWSDTSLMCGDKTIAFHSIEDEATEETQGEMETEVSANFRLMSFAPEMLETLKWMLKSSKLSVYDTRKLNELIKKATEV